MTDRPLWKITIAVLATEEEIDQIGERIPAAVCGDPDHPGPCATPWISITVDEGSLDADEARELRSLVLDD
ncbi:hypothetical protein GA0070604_3435 [Micromonospora eburnea]|uniref:Uncharacterized protein n=2 Tax=Micromonospora eburnea TaxID=227316 RepID=A0A1C6UR76_9ACTN|nr:hypothetical protein GA0070604_3435 [Micromonospora eburnea]